VISTSALAQQSSLKVGTPAASVELFDESRTKVGRVSTEGWAGKVPVSELTPARSTLYVWIDYPGNSKMSEPAGLPAGRYLVRRAHVMPREDCTLQPVRAAERDTRHGENGFGQLCKTSPN
jgi:hypothetical protein